MMLTPESEEYHDESIIVPIPNIQTREKSKNKSSFTQR
jgi:hypothetical protein